DLLPRAPRRAVRDGAVLDRAQAVLQVVEDEPDGRIGSGGRGDDAGACGAGLAADDEHAALERRRLELRETRQAPGLAEIVGLLEQRRQPLDEARRAGWVGNRRRQNPG